MRYLTYAEYLKWRRSQSDVRANEAADGLNIDAGGFSPWTDEVIYTGGSEASGGVLSEEEYEIIEFKARKIIDYWTDNRVKSMQKVPEAVKLCMKALIKLEQKYGVEAQLENPLISSYNTDGYSESYGSASEQETAANKAASRAIRQYLYGETDDKGVPLLYRGVSGY